MINFFKKNKKYLIWFIFYTIVVTISIIFQAILPYFFFQSLKNEKNYFSILWIAIYILMLIISYTIDGLNGYVFAKFKKDKKKEIANIFFDAFNKVSYHHYIKENSGTYYSWINNRITDGKINFYIGVLGIIRVLFSIISLVTLLLIFNWIVGIVILIISLVIMIYPLLFNKKYTNNLNKKLKFFDNFNLKLDNILKGYSTLYFLNKKEAFFSFIKNDAKILTKKYYKYVFFNNLQQVFQENMNTIAKLIVNIIAIFISLNNLNTIFKGISVFVFVNILGQEYWNLCSSFSSSLIKILESKDAKNSLENFLHEDIYQNKNFQKLNDEIKIIEFKNVSLNFNSKKIFKNLNLIIKKNKKYLIIGPNGSGKSSILKIMMGLERNYSGSAKINNLEIKNLNQKNLNSKFSLVSNNSLLLDGSLKYNISFSDHTNSNEIEKLANFVNLDYKIFRNKKFNEQIDNEVSVGEMQKINLARSLFHNNKFLIIDEGLSNLDDKNFEEIKNKLLEKKNLTLIMVTHHFKKEYFNKFDKIISLKDVNQ